MQFILSMGLKPFLLFVLYLIVNAQYAVNYSLTNICYCGTY